MVFLFVILLHIASNYTAPASLGQVKLSTSRNIHSDYCRTIKYLVK